MTKRLLNILFLLVIITFCYQVEAQQTVVKGRITDVETDLGLPYSTISYIDKNGETQGAVSDIDGYYRLETNDIVDSVMFQYSGYKNLKMKIQRFVTQTVNAKMESESVTLSAVEISAKRKVRGERYRRKGNPAVELIRKVQENKEINSIKDYNYFQYDEYSKVEIGLSNLSDSLRNKAIFKKMSFAFDNMQVSELTGKNYISLYFVENQDEIYYRKDPLCQIDILKASKDVEVSKFFDYSTLEPVMDNLIGSVDIYHNTIFMFNNEYTSPMSPIAVLFYHFYIADTLVYRGDTCAVLSFTPANQQDLGLCGSLWIKLDGSYAVKKAQIQLPRESGTNFVEAMLFEQEYESVDGIMLPQKYRLIVDLRYLNISLHAKRSGVMSNFIFNEPREKEFYDFNGATIHAKGYMENDDEAYWQEVRPDSLTEHEELVYEHNKRLMQVPMYKFIINTGMALGYEYIDMGVIDYGPIFNSVSWNSIEGMRYRIGAKTNTRFNKKLFLEGFVAYGTYDEAFKYRGQMMFSFNDKIYNQWEFPMNLLSLSYEHNTNVPGRSVFGQRYNTDFDRLGNSFSRMSLDKMVFIDKVNLMYDFELPYQIGFRFYTEYLEQRPLADLSFVSFNGYRYQLLTTLTFGAEIRYAHEEKVYQLQQYRYSLASSVAPVISIGYNYGAKILGGDYEFHKIMASFSKRWFFSVLGVADVDISGGRIFGSVPYPLLFVPKGNQGFYFDNTSFNLMNYYEFVGDYYLQTYLSYNFNGFLINRIPLLGKVKWREIVTFKALWGGLTPENKAIPANGSLFPLPMDKDGNPTTFILDGGPYLEGSIGIGNIFSFLRIDYVRRFTYLDNPNIDEWGVMFSVKFEF